MLNEVKIKYVVDSSDLQKATEAFDKLTAEEKAANAALDKFQSNLRQTGADSKAGIGPAVDGLEKGASAATRFGASIGKSQSQVRQFTTSLREAGAAAVTAGNKAAAGFSGVDAQLRKSKAAAAAFQQQLAQTKMPPAVGGAAGKGGGGGMDLFSQLAGMAKWGGRIFVAKQVYDSVVAITKAGIAVESLNAQFKYLTGSSAGAARQLDDIKTLSNQFGINFKAASGAYKDFAVASTLAGQSMEQTNDQFKAVAMASKALGLSGEQVSGAFRAMQQALSKGVLSAEELRGQLSEQIPGAFSLTAKAVGVTEAELGKMIESGNVLSADVMPLLSMQLQQTFGPQVLENANSLGSSFEGFINRWTIAFGGLGSALAPITKYLFDSVNHWMDMIGGAITFFKDAVEEIKSMSATDIFFMTPSEFFNLGAEKRAQRASKKIKDNIKFNTETEIAQYQKIIAAERGVTADQVSRGDASRRALQATTKAYDDLKFSVEQGAYRADEFKKKELEYANVRRGVLMAEVQKDKDAAALRAKIQADAAKGNAAKDKKDRQAKAEQAERERLRKLKEDFDAEKTRLEETQKAAKIDLEASKKDAATKAEELLRIEEKYLQDLIALREKYAKKEPKLAKEFTKGKVVEQAELGAVQGAIPFAAVDVRIKELGKVTKSQQKAQDEAYQTELKAVEDRMSIRESEIDAMDTWESEKRKLKIESEIKANEETMAVNEKFMNEGNADALAAVDSQNEALIAKNKALQKGLTAIDKEGNQERADLVSAWLQHIQSVFNGAMNLYQQNLAADLEASKARYSEEERLAGDNKQKLTEIREKQRNEEKEIKRKQFQAQKVQAIADVVFQTAPIIAKYGAQIFTIPLALAAVAAQAAQIGFILAQPVPEFAQGTRGRRHKGGPAMVGELGVEKVVTESGKVYYTPPTATLVDLPRGAQVIPNHELRKELFYASNMSRASGASVDPVVTGISEIGGILKSLPIHQINMDERGFEKYIRTPKRATKILNSRFPGN